MKKTVFLIIFCFALPGSLFGQVDIDSLRKVYKEKYLPVDSILGNWYSADSTLSKIEFFREGSRVIIKPRITGVDNYTFNIRGDSVSVNGYAPNWPPYDCIINFLGNDSLEVIFYQFQYDFIQKLYFTREE